MEKTYKPTNTPARPLVHYPTVMIPQGNGQFLFQAGKPEIMGSEISTAKFARETGMSQRNAVRLCEEGLVDCRRLTPKGKSKYMIQVNEVERHLRREGTLPRNEKRH